VENLWITLPLFHRFSTGCPQVFHRLSPLQKKLGKFYFHVIHRLSTGYPQVIHITKKLEKSCPPVVHRLSTGYPQVIHRIFDFLSKKEILLAKSPFSLFFTRKFKNFFLAFSLTLFISKDYRKYPAFKKQIFNRIFIFLLYT
jgi:hypothetical protein